MWTVSNIVCFGLLIVLSIIDIRYRKVPREMLIIGSAIAVTYQLVMRETDIRMLLGGMGIGIIFLLVSKVTEEGIGYGDSWGILCMGMYLGLWKLIEVLAGTFFLLLFAAILVLSVKRMSGNCGLPFFPFLLGGYLALLLTGGA